MNTSHDVLKKFLLAGQKNRTFSSKGKTFQKFTMYTYVFEFLTYDE